MCERLLRLKVYIELMTAQEHIPAQYVLSESQWRKVKEVVTLLKPFMHAQKLLEGEKYVTASLVPPIISKIRSSLVGCIDDESTSTFIKTLAQKMLKDFNVRWGSGEDGTIFTEWFEEGPHRRRKGIPTQVLLAFALDPRFKHLPGMSPEDQASIKSELRRRLLLLANEANANAQPQVDHDPPIAHHERGADGMMPQAQLHPRQRHYNDDPYGDLFEDVDEALEPIVPAAAPARPEQLEHFEALIDAQLVLFWSSAVLPRKSTTINGEMVLNNPLQWYRDHAKNSLTLRSLLPVESFAFQQLRLRLNACFRLPVSRSQKTAPIFYQTWQHH
jgi:hypothetical protein